MFNLKHSVWDINNLTSLVDTLKDNYKVSYWSKTKTDVVRVDIERTSHSIVFFTTMPLLPQLRRKRMTLTSSVRKDLVLGILGLVEQEEAER